MLVSKHAKQTPECINSRLHDLKQPLAAAAAAANK